MVTTTIRLPEELHKQLKEEAEKKGMTLNGYLLGVLWEQVKKGGGVAVDGNNTNNLWKTS